MKVRTFPLHVRPSSGPGVLSAPLNAKAICPQWAINALLRGEAVQAKYMPESDLFDLGTGRYAVLSAIPGPIVVEPVGPEWFRPVFCADLTDKDPLPF